jgi:hypothetical protein
MVAWGWGCGPFSHDPTSSGDPQRATFMVAPTFMRITTDVTALSDFPAIKYFCEISSFFCHSSSAKIHNVSTP